MCLRKIGIFLFTASLIFFLIDNVNGGGGGEYIIEKIEGSKFDDNALINFKVMNYRKVNKTHRFINAVMVFDEPFDNTVMVSYK